MLLLLRRSLWFCYFALFASAQAIVTRKVCEAASETASSAAPYSLQDHLEVALSALSQRGEHLPAHDWRPLHESPWVAQAARANARSLATIEQIYGTLLVSRSPKAALDYVNTVISSYNNSKLTRDILDSYDAPASEVFAAELFENIAGIPISFQTDGIFLARLVQNFPYLKLLSEFSSPAIGAAAVKDEHVAKILEMPRMNKSFEIAVRSISNLLLILKGDQESYRSFVQSQKSGALQWESFQQRHQQLRATIQNGTDLHAMITYLIINDLGKSTLIANSLGVFDPYADHDTLQLRMLDSGYIKPFEMLAPRYRSLIKIGARANVNSGQLRQGENLAINLKSGAGIGVEPMTWFLINDFIHVSAFLAPMNPLGSPLWNEDLNGRDLRMQKALLELAQDSKDEAADRAYRGFIAREAEGFGLDATSPVGFAATRLSLMLRVYDSKRAQEIEKILDGHPLRAALLRYLGTIDDRGILVYFAPDFLRLMSTPATAEASEEDRIKALKIALTALHRVFAEAETYRAGMTHDGPLTVSVEDIVKSQIPAKEWLRYQIDFLPTADGQLKALLVVVGSDGESPLTPLGLGILMKRAEQLAPASIGAATLSGVAKLSKEEIESLFLYQNTFFARILNSYLRKEMSDPLFDDLLEAEGQRLNSALLKLEQLPREAWKSFGIKRDVVVRYINISCNDLRKWVEDRFPEQAPIVLAGCLPDKVAFGSAAEDPTDQLEELPYNVKFEIHLNGRIPAHIWPFAIDGRNNAEANRLIEVSLDPVNAAFARRDLFREVLFSTHAQFDRLDITASTRKGSPTFTIRVQIRDD